MAIQFTVEGAKISGHLISLHGPVVDTDTGETIQERHNFTFDVRGLRQQAEERYPADPVRGGAQKIMRDFVLEYLNDVATREQEIPSVDVEGALDNLIGKQLESTA